MIPGSERDKEELKLRYKKRSSTAEHWGLEPSTRLHVEHSKPITAESREFTQKTIQSTIVSKRYSNFTCLTDRDFNNFSKKKENPLNQTSIEVNTIDDALFLYRQKTKEALDNSKFVSINRLEQRKKMYITTID